MTNRLLTALVVSATIFAASCSRTPDPLGPVATKLRDSRLCVVRSDGGLYVSREPHPLAELEAMPGDRAPDNSWNGVVWVQIDGGQLHYFGDPFIAEQVQWTMGLEPFSGPQFRWDANDAPLFLKARGGRP